MRLPWLLTALVSAAIMAAVDLWALADFLYWRFRWLDTPMHILGGFTLAVLFIGIFPTYRPRLFVVTIAVAVIAWEIFELFTNQPQQNPYFIDTIHDLINDSLGAMFAFALARETVWRSR